MVENNARVPARLKLTYFDFDGGRGEPARLALSIAAIPFNDHRVPVDGWPALKPQMPLQALPVLEVDAVEITQSNTINRYVGRLAGLYPVDPLEAAFCDEVMDAVEEITEKIVATFPLEGAEKEGARRRLAEGPIPLYLTRLVRLLERGGAEYFADGRLTVADLRAFLWIRHLRSGALDHVPRDLADRVAPLLVKHFERINADANVASYYTRRRTASAPS
jgi:glutathione S-transferase